MSNGDHPATANDEEPTFVLRASDRLAPHLLRFWAGAYMQTHPEQAALALAMAARMDAWREKHK